MKKISFVVLFANALFFQPYSYGYNGEHHQPNYHTPIVDGTKVNVSWQPESGKHDGCEMAVEQENKGALKCALSLQHDPSHDFFEK